MYFFCNSAVCKITMGRHHTYFLPTPYLKLSTLNCLCCNTHILNGSSISANRNFAHLLFWVVKEFKDYGVKTWGYVIA